MAEIEIQLVGGTVPMFRLTSEEGPLARLLEIKVTEVGSTEPSWLVAHEAARLDDLVETGIITRAEAERAGVARLRFLDEMMLKQTAVPVSELRYGEVPTGMYEVRPAKALATHRLYELRVSGHGEGELQFYA